MSAAFTPTCIEWPATYTDGTGRESITICNDSATLNTVIRGVSFAGSDFDSLHPDASTPRERLAPFVFAAGALCACEVTAEIPLPVVGPGGEQMAVLSMTLQLGQPRPDGGIDDETLRLVLTYPGARFESTGTSGWFEDELRDLQAQLPAGTFLKSCFVCLYADYSPYGHGLFGNLLCFRNIKDEYLRVKSKEAFWRVQDRAERAVQETYLCAEFTRRVAGTGYRG